MKKDCIDSLKVYYGIKPYDKPHPSQKSGIFYDWIIKKYGKELINECEKELGRVKTRNNLPN